MVVDDRNMGSLQHQGTLNVLGHEADNSSEEAHDD